MYFLYSTFLNNARISSAGNICIGFNKCSRYKNKTCFIRGGKSRFVFHFHNSAKYISQGTFNGHENTVKGMEVIEKPNKPPNIFVFTGEENAKSYEHFETIKEHLLLCINPYSYAIYMLQPSQVEKLPWLDNTSLLVISTVSKCDLPASFASTYFEKGGKVLISNACLEAVDGNILHKFDYGKWKSIATVRNDNRYDVTISSAERTVLVHEERLDGSPEIVKYSSDTGILIISLVQLMLDPMKFASDKETFTLLKESATERLHVLRDILQNHFYLDCKAQSIPDPTPVFMLAKNDRILNDTIKSLSSRWSNKHIRLKKTSLELMETPTENCKPSKESVPVIFGSKPNSTLFDENIFYQHLKTRKLGHTLLYSDVVGSTMDLLDGLTCVDGAVCVASRQTQGKGRGANQWLSPPGCAMCTLHLSVPLYSNLGQSLSFIQHLMALAVVTAVRTLPGYEELDLKIKWPNDIYFGSRIKLGGVIVSSTLYGHSVHCYVGMGVNLDNRNPTMCINEVIGLYNRETGHTLPLLRVEEMIPMVLQRMEDLIEMFQKKGIAACTSIYYQYWLHSNQQLVLEATGQQVTVQGVDDCGYLVVRTENGEVLTLQPDGNGLDLMTGMIVMRSK